jgi:hypothetical protein
MQNVVVATHEADVSEPRIAHQILLRAEAAEFLGLPLDEFDELVKAGAIRRYAPGLRGGRYKRAEIVALMSACVAAEPTPAEPPAIQESAVPPEPTARPAWVHLYAVEIIGVGTKIGITNKPLQRIASHVAAARDFGRRVGRVWVSLRHQEAERNEQRLMISWHRRRKSEYLRVPFETVMARIDELPMTFEASP